jgi:hypothetical protein
MRCEERRYTRSPGTARQGQRRGNLLLKHAEKWEIACRGVLRRSSQRQVNFLKIILDIFSTVGVNSPSFNKKANSQRKERTLDEQHNLLYPRCSWQIAFSECACRPNLGLFLSPVSFGLWRIRRSLFCLIVIARSHPLPLSCFGRLLRGRHQDEHYHHLPIL